MLNQWKKQTDSSPFFGFPTQTYFFWPAWHGKEYRHLKGLEGQCGCNGENVRVWRLLQRDRQRPDQLGFACCVKEFCLYPMNNRKPMMAFQIINQKYCSRKKSQAMSKNGRLDTSKEVIVMVQAKDGGWSVQGYGTEIICCPPNIWLCLCISQSILLFNEFMWLVIASGIWADGCMSLLDRGNRWAASVSLCPCYGDLGAPTFRW